VSQHLLSSTHSLLRAPYFGSACWPEGCADARGSLPTPTGHGDRAFAQGQGVRPIARARSDHRCIFPTTSVDLRQSRRPYTMRSSGGRRLSLAKATVRHL